MGERKVINKYLPPDFDPSLIPRSKRPKDGLVSVRMMLPFSIQCSTCSTFMYRGRKFNSKKENVQGPNGKYLGIQRFRFYIKCTACSRPITFLTDPKNADYEMESGATRNYEMAKDKQATEENFEKEQEEENKEDPLRGLESRVLASQREMQDMDNLEEIKALNMRHLHLMSSKGGEGGVGAEAQAIMAAREEKMKKQSQKEQDEELNENGLTETEEALVKSIQFGAKMKTIRRLDEEDERNSEAQRKQQALLFEKQQRELNKPATVAKKTMPIVRVKRRRPAPKEEPIPKKQKEEETPPAGDGGGIGGLLGGYGSDSDSD